MLNFEEYMARRKKEDHITEFDVNARSENIKTCVNYVFLKNGTFIDYLPGGFVTKT